MLPGHFRLDRRLYFTALCLYLVILRGNYIRYSRLFSPFFEHGFPTFFVFPARYEIYRWSTTSRRSNGFQGLFNSTPSIFCNRSISIMSGEVSTYFMRDYGTLRVCFSFMLLSAWTKIGSGLNRQDHVR